MSAVTVENLEFHIKKTGMSSEGAKVLYDYADALRALRDAGVSRNPISKDLAANLAAIGNAMKSIDSAGVSMLRQLSNALKTFSDLKSIKLDPNFSQTLIQIADATKKIDEECINRLNKLFQSLQLLKGAKTNIGDKLPIQILNLNSAMQSITDETIAKIHRLTWALSRLKGVDLSGLGAVLKGQNDAWKIQQQQQRAQSGQSSNAQQTGTGNTGPAGTRINWHDAIEGAKKFNNVVQKVVSSVVKELKKILRVIGMIGKQFASAFSRMFGISGIAREANRLKGILSSFTRVAFYRAVRTAIKAITEAFKEGSENAYWYSKKFGESTRYISEALDGLSSAGYKTKNQLGAAWATLLATIQPILIKIVNLVTKAAEVVTEFFAILGGKGTYLKAIDYNKEWADSADQAGKAAKEWRNQLMGFDEINRLDAPSDGNNGNGSNLPDYGSMFEEVPVTRNFLSDLIDQIKNGEWSKIGEMLAEKVNGLVDSIDWNSWGNKIGEKINAAIQTIYSFLKNVDFKNLGSSIAQGLMGMMDAIDFETVGRLFVRKFTAMLDFIIGFVTTPGFWEKLAKSVGDLFHGALSEASEWLNENNLADVIGKVGQGILGVLQRVSEEIKEHRDVFIQIGQQIGNALAAIPWVDILKTIADILWTVFKSLIIDGLLSTEGGKIFAALFLGLKGLKLAFTMAGPVIEAGVAILAKGIAQSLLGIPAAVTSAGTATATAASSMGPTIGAGMATWTAAVTKSLTEFTVAGETLLTGAAAALATGAMAVTDAVLVAYDVNALQEAKRTYEETGAAINQNVEANKNGFIKILETQGREAADKYAEMILGVQTYGMDYQEALSTIEEETKKQYEGVPKSMMEGFKQGWDYYFGNGSQGGFIVLVEDAFKNMVSGVKSLLGINSPSRVFSEIGKNLVEGLKSGFQNAWSSFSSATKQMVSSVVSNISNSISNAVQSAWSSVNSLVSKAKSALSSLSSSLSSKVSSAMSTVRNIASSISIRAYASGGFPEDGLFYANHGEMVGQFTNGQTAVANNEQIVEGISEGVYQAVAAALASGNMGSDTPVNIYMDGKLIAQSTTKYQKQFARAAG